MVSITDLEKQAPAPEHHGNSQCGVSSPTVESNHPDKNTRADAESYTQSRPLSSSSVDTDPLSPLEHALGRPVSATEIEISPAPLDDEDDEDEDHDGDPNNDPMHLTRTHTSITSSASRHPDFEVTLDADDPENPRNWPLWYRAYTVLSVSYATWVVVLYSTSYTATIPGIMDEFGVTSRSVATLGLTTYLLGLAAGSVVVAPMSELYGRRVVYLVCLGVFVVLIVPCGLARSLGVIVGVRFIGYVVVPVSHQQGP
ncbi:hypothetical protein VTI74DRAFT_8749 [Chaetomium olivicolor]